MRAQPAEAGAASGSREKSPHTARNDIGSDPTSPSARGRFPPDRIIAILNEQSSGTPVAELCRRHGISTTTFFRWRKRYGGEAPAEGTGQARVRRLEEENGQLKRLLAEAVLENATFRERFGLGNLFGKT